VLHEWGNWGKGNMKKSLLVFGIILILAGPLILVTGTTYTLMLPNIYQSTARIHVQDTSPVAACTKPCPHCSIDNPYFLRTQIEIIQSKPILHEVINRLNLQSKWSREGEKLPRDVAYKILKNSVSVFQQRDTSLIAIFVKRDNPNEAARIANEIAQVYRDSRLDLVNKESRLAIDKMAEALKGQRLRVDEAEKALEQLRVEFDIPVNGGRNADVDNIRLQQLEGDRLAAQREMVEKEGLLKIMEDLDDKNLIERASYITFDQLVMNTIQQMQDIDAQLNSMKADYGSNHPEVQRFELQKQTLEEALSKRLKALRNGLKTEYTMAKINFDSLDNILKDMRGELTSAQAEKFRPFRKAQADLDTERFIYDQLKAKHRQKIIQLDVPRNPVAIIDVAEPNHRPVSPNLFMNVLMSLALGAVPTITGIVLVVVGTTRKRSAL